MVNLPATTTLLLTQTQLCLALFFQTTLQLFMVSPSYFFSPPPSPFLFCSLQRGKWLQGVYVKLFKMPPGGFKQSNSGSYFLLPHSWLTLSNKRILLTRWVTNTLCRKSHIQKDKSTNILVITIVSIKASSLHEFLRPAGATKY